MMLQPENWSIIIVQVLIDDLSCAKFWKSWNFVFVSSQCGFIIRRFRQYLYLKYFDLLSHNLYTGLLLRPKFSNLTICAAPMLLPHTLVYILFIFSHLKFIVWTVNAARIACKLYNDTTSLILIV